VFDLLKLKNLKIATAESFTAGRIVASLIQNSGASSYVHEGIVCYSNLSKSERTGIDPCTLEKEGAVSSMTAYRMAAGLIKTGNVDVALSTTGVAGPNGDGSTAPVGLCFVGVGMKDGVHTYKLNLCGSREEITETAKNTALFLTFKKLKSIE
jgi:nicotinamide-nucleotide amidase